MESNETGKAAKGGGKRVFKNSLHEKLLAWKNGTDISAVGEVAGIPETAWCGGGDIVSFPSSLSPAERRIAHQLCLRLDLFHASSGDGENRFVTVSKSGDFESIQQSATADHQATNYCIWYDERAAKPLVKSRYFLLSETEIQGLQRTLATTAGSVNGRVTVTLSSEFLLNFEIKNLSHMSHMNAKWPEGGKNRSDAECEQDMDKPHVIVETVEGLRVTAAALSACAEMAFDLEMHSYRTYHGLTCLIQLSGGGVNYIVDPLAPNMWEAVSTLLGPIFANPNIVKIGHGIMGGDIPALFRDFGIIVVNAFDTQEASGFLGRTGVGLAALLDLWGCPLRREVATLKDQMKHADWRLRPMTDVMLRYATLDVHYLVSLYKLQVRELLLSAVACVGKIGRTQQGQGGLAVQKNGSKKQISSNVVKSKDTVSSSNSESTNGLKSVGGNSDRLDSGGEKDGKGQGQGHREKEGEGEDEEGLGGTTVTDDSLAVHLHLDNRDSSGLMEDIEEEGKEVWGLDPAPDAGSNYKSKSHHLSDRFDDEGEGGEDEEGEEGGVEVLAATFLDEDILMAMDGGDDDDDMWDGWGEEAPTETGTGTGIQSADDDLAAELEVCFKAISSTSPKAAKPKGKGKGKGALEKEGDEHQVVVKSNNKKSSKNDTAAGGKEAGSGTGSVKPLSSRAQQQQKRREIKALRHEREQAKQRALLESRLVPVTPAVPAPELEHGEIDEEGEVDAAVEEVSEEQCSVEGGESDVNDIEVEGEVEGDIDMEEEAALPVYDDALLLERRLRGEGVLRAIAMQYKTSPTPVAGTASTTTDMSKSKNSVSKSESSKSENGESAIMFLASDLGSDPRLAELLGALAASQQCCLKLWVPKKSSENAYAKVSGFSQRKKTRTASGQWEAKNVFVFRRLFLWREKEAERRDESPSYICRGSLLLDAAEFLPTSISSLMKLQSPLPASMRVESPEGVKVEPEVDIVGAVKEALEVWEGVVRKQALSNDREDGAPLPDGTHYDKEKYVKQVHNSNSAKLLDKKATQSTAVKQMTSKGEMSNGHHVTDVNTATAAAVAVAVVVVAPLSDAGVTVPVAIESKSKAVAVDVELKSKGAVKVEVEVEDMQMPIDEKKEESRLPHIPSSLSTTSSPTSTSTLASSPGAVSAVLGVAAVISLAAIVILRYRAK